jgi:hypothetical protein
MFSPGNIIKIRVLGSKWCIAKAGHEPVWAELGASLSLARSKLARLGLARLSHEPEKRARPELASESV